MGLCGEEGGERGSNHYCGNICDISLLDAVVLTSVLVIDCNKKFKVLYLHSSSSWPGKAPQCQTCKLGERVKERR